MNILKHLKNGFLINTEENKEIEEDFSVCQFDFFLLLRNITLYFD